MNSSNACWFGPAALSFVYWGRWLDTSSVVPLRAMLRHHRATGSTIPVRLLYSARSLEDVIYRDELTAADRNDVRDLL
jgi:hypothetical protein